MDTTTMAILGANMLAKIILQYIQSNPNTTEAELTALIADNGAKIKVIIDTINTEMAQFSEAK